MNIDDYRQTRGQNHVECTVDVLEISGVENRRIGRFAEQRRRFNRKAHVIEAHRLDECDVLGRRVSFEMCFRVIGGLGKPVTQVNSATQTSESRGEIRRFFLCSRCRTAENLAPVATFDT